MIIAALLALAGLSSGWLHAHWLAAATGGSADARHWLARVFLPTATLTTAALAGHVLLAASGWGLGFGVGVAWALRRWEV
jgi:hypothetical protein